MPELNGFYEHMDYATYAAVDALNGSSIIHMRRSPLKYRHAKDNPSPETPALKLGTATHKLILEPKTVLDFEVWGKKEDQKVRRGGVWDKFQAEHANKHIVTEGEWESMCDIASAANRHPLISKYVNAPGKTELSMFWRHPYTGRRMKARIDKVIVDKFSGGGEKAVAAHDRIKMVRTPTERHTIVDLKTTRDARSFRFGPQAHQLGYVVKMALYAQGYEVLTGHKPIVKLIALESKAPHEGAPYNVPEDVLLVGLEELDKLIDRLSECEQSNHWPAAQEIEEDLTLPAWASYEAETELELEA
jgi:hypothetical protein